MTSRRGKEGGQKVAADEPKRADRQTEDSRIYKPCAACGYNRVYRQGALSLLKAQRGLYCLIYHFILVKKNKHDG